jgi:hypothetical protein
MKPMLTPPGIKRLKLQSDGLLSIFGFKFYLRRYIKGIAPLFESKDAKIRGAAKDLTVELTRWLGPDAVKRDLIDKMRDTMQAEVREMIGAVKAGAAARATRLTRQEQAIPPAGAYTRSS